MKCTHHVQMYARTPYWISQRRNKEKSMSPLSINVWGGGNDGDSCGSKPHPEESYQDNCDQAGKDS